MAEFIRQSLLFPVIQSVHIIGLTVLVGTICLVDLRLLGIGMNRQAVSELASRLAPWTSGGLMTVLVTGPLLFGSDLTRYLNNPAFVLKMLLLGIALAAHFTLHRSVLREGVPLKTATRKLAAALSLILWSSVVLAGRAIADFDIRPV
jgi:purine-cytosine permease-like protein